MQRGRSALWPAGNNTSSASPKNGSRKCKSGSMPAVNFRMPCAKCSLPTRNCWYWHVNNVIDERSYPTAPVELRHAVPGFAIVFPIARRWSTSTTDSRQSFALVDADRPSAAHLGFPCRGKVGAFLGTSGSGGEQVV